MSENEDNGMDYPDGPWAPGWDERSGGASESFRSPAGSIPEYPWLREPLNKWAICGMGHYHAQGKRHLFVSMVKDGKCITSEGEDDEAIWNNLTLQAEGN